MLKEISIIEALDILNSPLFLCKHKTKTFEYFFV